MQGVGREDDVGLASGKSLLLETAVQIHDLEPHEGIVGGEVAVEPLPEPH